MKNFIQIQTIQDKRNKKVEKEDSNNCSECDGNIIQITHIGETVCSQCGLVFDERCLDLSYRKTQRKTQK